MPEKPAGSVSTADPPSSNSLLHLSFSSNSDFDFLSPFFLDVEAISGVSSEKIMQAFLDSRSSAFTRVEKPDGSVSTADLPSSNPLLRLSFSSNSDFDSLSPFFQDIEAISRVGSEKLMPALFGSGSSAFTRVEKPDGSLPRRNNQSPDRLADLNSGSNTNPEPEFVSPSSALAMADNTDGSVSARDYPQGTSVKETQFPVGFNTSLPDSVTLGRKLPESVPLDDDDRTSLPGTADGGNEGMVERKVDEVIGIHTGTQPSRRENVEQIRDEEMVDLIEQISICASFESDEDEIQQKSPGTLNAEKHQVNCKLPKIGMVFPSEAVAYEFYKNYSTNIGFCVRKGKVQRLANGNVRKKYFFCSRQGFRSKKQSNKTTKYKRKETRIGCKAMIQFTFENGEWVVSDLNLEHNHKLMSSSQMCKSCRNISNAHEIFNSVNETGMEKDAADAQNKEFFVPYTWHPIVTPSFIESWESVRAEEDVNSLASTLTAVQSKSRGGSRSSAIVIAEPVQPLAHSSSPCRNPPRGAHSSTEDPENNEPIASIQTKDRKRLRSLREVEESRDAAQPPPAKQPTVTAQKAAEDSEKTALAEEVVTEQSTGLLKMKRSASSKVFEQVLSTNHGIHLISRPAPSPTLSPFLSQESPSLALIPYNPLDFPISYTPLVTSIPSPVKVTTTPTSSPTRIATPTPFLTPVLISSPAKPLSHSPISSRPHSFCPGPSQKLPSIEAVLSEDWLSDTEEVPPRPKIEDSFVLQAQLVIKNALNQDLSHFLDSAIMDSFMKACTLLIDAPEISAAAKMVLKTLPSSLQTAAISAHTAQATLSQFELLDSNNNAVLDQLKEHNTKLQLASKSRHHLLQTKQSISIQIAKLQAQLSAMDDQLSFIDQELTTLARATDGLVTTAVNLKADLKKFAASRGEGQYTIALCKQILNRAREDTRLFL